MAAPLSGAAIGAWGLLRGSRVVNVGNAVVLVVLVLLAVGVIWGLAYAASQSSGLPAVLLNGAVVFAAALALFFCAAGATTLFDDPNVARERAKQRKAEKRLRRQGRPWVIPCPPGRRGTERHRVVRRG